MKKSVVFGTVGLAAMLMVSGFGHEVVAQGAGLIVGGARSNFGTVSLAPGFVPDPHSRTFAAGGPVDVSSLGHAGCVGFVTRQPDYILRLTGTSANLKIKFNVRGAAANSPTDTTLVVNTAGGEWRCNDDTNGANPQVNLPGATAGQYDIWVGSYQASGHATGTLQITEL